LRLDKKRAREEFHEFLQDWMQNDMSIDIPFRQLAEICHSLPCWSMLDIEELDDIFQDFLDDFERRNHHKITEKVYEQQRMLYKELEACVPPLEPGKTSWADIANRRWNNDYSKLDNMDKFQVFEDFMKDRIHDEREKRRKTEQRIARKHRQNFATFLESKKNAIMTDGLKWSEFLEKFNIKESSQEYQELIGTKHSSQPYDLFGEMRSKWKQQEEDVQIVYLPCRILGFFHPFRNV